MEAEKLSLSMTQWLIMDSTTKSWPLSFTFDIAVAGIEKLMKTYSENPSFSNQKNLEETEQQLDEVNSVQHVAWMDIYFKLITNQICWSVH